MGSDCSDYSKRYGVAVPSCTEDHSPGDAMTTNRIADRSEAVIAAILPRSVRVRRDREDGHSVCLQLNGKSVAVKWIGEGALRQARDLIAGSKNPPDVVVARRMSPGAREALSAAGVGWADETGAAEIALGTLIVSRSGRPSEVPPKPLRWTPSVLAVAEALLCGGKPTVSGMQKTTGLSTGSATSALRVLTDLGLLASSAQRGRGSGRFVPDQDRLLDEYATAAGAMVPATALTAGVTWRDFAAGLSEAGHRWTSAGIAWAATGSVAALVLAPYLTAVTTGLIYIDRETISGLESVAVQAGLRPMEGGRLTLRPFPTVAVKRLAVVRDGLPAAPWPRVYADLRSVGVRGEEAAEHLREVIRGR